MKIKVARSFMQYYDIELGYDLTENELKCIEVIENYKMYNKKVPTIRKIMQMLNLKSPASILHILNKLKEKGYNYRML